MAAARRETIGEGTDALTARVLGDPANDPVALVLHGRNGAPEQPHIEAIVSAYRRRGLASVVPELPHSAANPGSGEPAALSFRGQAIAVRRVAEWLAGQAPGRPVAVAGHSLGAFAAPRVAETLPLAHVLAVSPVVSGQALLEARRSMGPEAVAALAAEAPALRAEMTAATAVPAIAALAVPVAVVTGAEDALTPPADARTYLAAAAQPRFFAVLPGQDHCPVGAATDTVLDAALIALGA